MVCARLGHGAGSLIPRRFVIGVDNHCRHESAEACCLFRLPTSRADGVVELRKLVTKHVLSDATDDHVQELAAMGGRPNCW